MPRGGLSTLHRVALEMLRSLSATCAPGSCEDPAFCDPASHLVPYEGLAKLTERVQLTIKTDGSRVKLLISGCKSPGTAASVPAGFPIGAPARAAVCSAPPPPTIPGALVDLKITSNGAGAVLDIQRCTSSLVEVVVERSATGGVVLDIVRSTASANHFVVEASDASSPPAAAEFVEALVSQELSATQARLSTLAKSIGLTSARFWRVPSEYYDQELEWRRNVLGATSTKQLCKSMIMENTKLVDVSPEDAKARGRYKYVCVVLQYDGPKLHKDKLTDIVRTLEGSNAAAKKQYNMRMVAGELSTALSGRIASTCPACNNVIAARCSQLPHVPKRFRVLTGHHRRRNGRLRAQRGHSARDGHADAAAPFGAAARPPGWRRVAWRRRAGPQAARRCRSVCRLFRGDLDGPSHPIRRCGGVAVLDRSREPPLRESMYTIYLYI